MAKGLYANINRRKKLGISRPKSKSTITKKSYANMKAGFPKKRKGKLWVDFFKTKTSSTSSPPPPLQLQSQKR